MPLAKREILVLMECARAMLTHLVMEDGQRREGRRGLINCMFAKRGKGAEGACGGVERLAWI